MVVQDTSKCLSGDLSAMVLSPNSRRSTAWLRTSALRRAGVRPTPPDADMPECTGTGGRAAKHIWLVTAGLLRIRGQNPLQGLLTPLVCRPQHAHRTCMPSRKALCPVYIPITDAKGKNDGAQPTCPTMWVGTNS
jgi:hypothetical protein